MATDERPMRIVFYRAVDAKPLDGDTMPPGRIDPAVHAELDLSPISAGTSTEVVFKGFGSEGFSLVHATFKPGYRLPHHSHSADCLYYVLAGSLHMGSRVLHQGDGFFVKADTPYAYSAGDNGVEVLEFRTATSFDMNIRDQTVAQWRPVLAAALANRDRWAESDETVRSNP
jgi:quercetin dioxygenase-like cupin family protein